MLNVLIPITKNFDKYKPLLNSLVGALDVNIFLGLTQESYAAADNIYGEEEGFNLFEFDVYTDKEEMINSMQEYIREGAIMVLRKPITINEFEKMLSLDRDVIMCKKPRNKMKAFLFSIWQKITKLILGVKMYAGDTSAILFNKDFAEMIIHSENLSYSTRVNRWKAIKQAVITINGESEKPKLDKAINVKYILLSSLLVVAGAVVTTMVCLFAEVSIIIGLLLFCVDAICVSVAFILIIMLIFNNMTGKRQCKKGIILNKKIEGVE